MLQLGRSLAAFSALLVLGLAGAAIGQETGAPATAEASESTDAAPPESAATPGASAAEAGSSTAVDGTGDTTGSAPMDPDNARAATDEEAADLYRSPGPPVDDTRYPELDMPAKSWSYSTDYFFYLTRRLPEERLSTWGRRACMVGTVPLDIVVLPFAAVAGLFGS